MVYTFGVADSCRTYSNISLPSGFHGHKRVFDGGMGRIYRVGGDEFVAIVYTSENFYAYTGVDRRRH